MLKKNIETFLSCDAEYDQAKIVIFGAPFDSTTSYRPGCRFGSRAIRSESIGLETYSPYLDKDIKEVQVFDSGDLELCFGDSQLSLAAIRERTEIILSDGKIPLMLGGEHLVTAGAVEAVAKRYADLNIIHFDAHADLRDSFFGTQLSHACVLRRCWDMIGDGRIFQFGIRSGDREEFIWGKSHVSTRKFDFDGLKETVASLKGKPVYFTLDLDVLDPSIMSGTGTPEAGGVSFSQLLEAVFLVCKDTNVVGCDVTELAPDYDTSGVSTAVACKIVRELILCL